MARPKKSGAKIGGPYLASAVFCDQILQEPDNALSAIRIVDQVSILLPHETPEDVPSEGKRLPISLWALLIFKTGMAKKLKRRFRLVMYSPSGNSQTVQDREVTFGDRPQSGVNLRIAVNIAIKEGGLFWVDVMLDETVMTKMFLDISIKREQPATPAATPAPVPRRKNTGVAQQPPPAMPPAKRRRVPS